MNDRERNQAIKEAHNIAASEAYFEVRAAVVNPQPHTIFDAGFSRGWDAGRAAIEAHEARKVQPCKVVDVGFRWDADRQEHVPSIKVEFEPVKHNGPNDAQGWKDRDALAAMLASAPPAPVREPLDCLHINKGSADLAAMQYEADYWAQRFQDKADNDKKRGALQPVSYYVRNAIQTMLAHRITKEKS